MKYPHVMRLAGPWDYEVLRAGASSLPSPAGSAHQPADWVTMLGEGFRGRVRCERRFHRPTNLDPRERVWIVIEGKGAAGRVLLNNEALGELHGWQQPAEFDLTSRLLPYNSLTIEVDCSVETVAGSRPRLDRERLTGGLLGDVRLEIRLAAADR